MESDFSLKAFCDLSRFSPREPVSTSLKNALDRQKLPQTHNISLSFRENLPEKFVLGFQLLDTLFVTVRLVNSPGAGRRACRRHSEPARIAKIYRLENAFRAHSAPRQVRKSPVRGSPRRSSINASYRRCDKQKTLAGNNHAARAVPRRACALSQISMGVGKILQSEEFSGAADLVDLRRTGRSVGLRYRNGARNGRNASTCSPQEPRRIYARQAESAPERGFSRKRSAASARS